MTEEIQFRQGDVFLIECEKPRNTTYTKLRAADTDIVASGEATNHHHRVIDGAEIFMMGAREMYVFVSDPKAKLVHDEHEPISLEAGVDKWFRVQDQREYDPRSQRSFRNVRD